MSDQSAPYDPDTDAGRPIVFRGGTVVTMDDDLGDLDGGDVLVVDGEIAAVGMDLDVPDDAVEVDASGGIVMPGMIDTHRHMWQTAMRGYGADWSLTQYFVFYYLNHGSIWRPQDIYAGNLLSAIESLDAGVTTTVDWSHGLQTVDHAEGAADALREVPGRFVLAYGNIQDQPSNWVPSQPVKDFLERNRASKDALLQVQLAFDVTGDPEFPEKAAFEAARELGMPVTTHAGVWGATNDDSIRLMSEHGFMSEDVTYVHAASLNSDSYNRIAASGAHVSVSTESEQNAGQGYPPTWQLRKHQIPVSLSMDTSVWWSADAFASMRSTMSADRSREHMAAHRKEETVVHHQLRSSEVVTWATMGGAENLGMADLVGSLTPGKRADVVLVKNDRDPAMFPILNPHGHLVFQAGRGDVHTVVVDGRIVKHDHELLGLDLDKARRAVGETVDFLRSEMGEEEWAAGMTPDLPDEVVFQNPYQYSEWKGGRAVVESKDLDPTEIDTD